MADQNEKSLTVFETGHAWWREQLDGLPATEGATQRRMTAAATSRAPLPRRKNGVPSGAARTPGARNGPFKFARRYSHLVLLPSLGACTHTHTHAHKHVHALYNTLYGRASILRAFERIYLYTWRAEKPCSADGTAHNVCGSCARVCIIHGTIVIYIYIYIYARACTPTKRAESRDPPVIETVRTATIRLVSRRLYGGREPFGRFRVRHVPYIGHLNGRRGAITGRQESLLSGGR